MAAAIKKKRKEEAYPWKAGASSGHVANLKQSILETFNIYGWHPGTVSLTPMYCYFCLLAGWCHILFTSLITNLSVYNHCFIPTCGLFYKCFTIVIYDLNDIGLNYKTRDNPN
jgi:hypothetical protein